MKISLSWLQDYLSTSLSPEEIAEKLTMIGLEVDDIIRDAPAGEVILDIALTPNLAHCLSVRGIARELSALTGDALKTSKVSSVEQANDPIEKHVKLQVQEPSSCPRYACRLIRGVRVEPSPEWLQKRLEMCGLRSVNNVVDCTNFVMLGLGQPLHAFDFATIEGGVVIVRKAKKEESLVTLDGKEHALPPDALLICDASKPLALAGIMGSQESEVTEKTTDVLLEAAYFEPREIRRTARKLETQSDASYRFERGTDPNGVLEALDLATALICELAKGTASSGVLEAKLGPFQPHVQSVRLSRINRLLGTKLAMSEVETIFRKLHFELMKTEEDRLTLSIPTYRHDVKEEIDLVEEVGRFYGLDLLKKGEKPLFRLGQLLHSPEYLFEKQIRTAGLRLGLQELLTCDLISPEQAGWIHPDCFPKRTLIKLLNPSSSEQSVMRPTLLPGFLQVAKLNQDHGNTSISGFEIGRVHFSDKDKFCEPSVVSFLLMGAAAPAYLESKPRFVDFYDLKGVVEDLCAFLRLDKCRFEHSRYSNFHPGRQASIFIDQMEVGIMGEVHPLTLKEAGVHSPLYFAELNLEDLYRALPPPHVMKPLSLFPASTRDLTLTLHRDQQVGPLLTHLSESGSELLESISLLDVYTSEALGSDKKNVTVRFIYRHRERTLSVAEVEAEHQKVTARPWVEK